MRPIEPGCLAIIISNPYGLELAGQMVRVISRELSGGFVINNMTTFTSDTLWNVECEGMRGVIEDRFLMRIDDYDPSQDVVEEDKAVEA